MVRIPQNTTLCTVCSRHVGVRPSWVRWQAGQSHEWRVARHGKPRICDGSGITVVDALVFPNRVVS